jgi:hypothetical protein
MAPRNKSVAASADINAGSQGEGFVPACSAAGLAPHDQTSSCRDSRAHWVPPRLEKLGNVADATLIGFGTSGLG